MLSASEMSRAPESASPSGPILFYDGVCGLCDRTVQFVLRHDRQGRFRFAALQGASARRLLERHGRDPSRLDSMYLLLDPDTPRERVLERSDGILAVLQQLGGIWRLSAVARAVPRSLRNRTYDFIARHRYRWFGRYDQCALPPPGARGRFFDDGAALPSARPEPDRADGAPSLSIAAERHPRL